MKSVMKSIITAIVISVVLNYQAVSYAQNEANTHNYMLSTEKDKSNRVYNVKFNVDEDCIVVITAKSKNKSEEVVIVDGEVEKGEHIIIFKPSESFSNVEIIFRMEVYAIGSHSKLFSVQTK